MKEVIFRLAGLIEVVEILWCLSSYIEWIVLAEIKDLVSNKDVTFVAWSLINIMYSQSNA